jgi:thioredoxin 1
MRQKMNAGAAIAARESRPDCRRLAGHPARRAPCQAAGLIACAILVLAAGGCGPTKFRAIATEEEFEEQVLKADKPVLVDFFKGGCASCMVLDPLLDQLSEEYKDRVIFAKFEGMRFWLQIPCWSIVWRYHIALYPTVVLFVNGKEKKRWIANYFGHSYRAALDQVAPASAREAAKAEKPAARRRPEPLRTSARVNPNGDGKDSDPVKVTAPARTGVPE